MNAKTISLLSKKRTGDKHQTDPSTNKPNKKKKEKESDKEKEKNTIEDDKEETNDNSKAITSILQYFCKKISEDWKSKETLDLKKYCESIGIFAESNYKLLQELLNLDLDLFIQYYPTYQFTLTLDQRRNIQKMIKNCDNCLMIKNNYIKDELKSIRELFLKICDLIVNTNFRNKEWIKDLESQIINNGAFIQENKDFFLPVTHGNIELKFNKLIIDVLYFIFSNNLGNINNLNVEEKQLIKNKISQFKEAKIFYQESVIYDDETLFKVNNYLINCYYILNEVEDSLKDYDNLRRIITCCLPFKSDTAINFIKDASEFSSDIKFEIDGIIIDEYEPSNITKDSLVKISFKKKIIETKAEDVNWNLKPNIFFQLFISDNFMFCFRFPKLNEINYINLNEDIKNNYKNLLKKILKSKIMEECMNIDSEAKKFKYPFKDDNIIKELEDNTLFVPLPVKNFYGYSDRVSFTVYLNSAINTTNLKTIFIDYDNLIKSECHEYKHIYRLYMHINEPKISLKTPSISRNTLSKNELIKDNKSSFEKNIKKLTKLYEDRIIPKSEINSLDYGDILEFAMNGDKQDVFFIKNSLFCLTEKSWDMEPKKFFDEYFNSCREKKFTLRNQKESHFISSVINFHDIPTNLEIVNDSYPSKRARATRQSPNTTFEGEMENYYIIIPRANHCRIKK